MINWMANPLMGTPSAARKEVIEKLADVKVLPLYISVDAFMGESTYLADYVIPDTTQFENWGITIINGVYCNKSIKGTLASCRANDHEIRGRTSCLL